MMRWLLSRAVIAAIAAVNVAIAYANVYIGMASDSPFHWVNLALVPVSVVSAIFLVLTCVKPGR